MSSSDNRLYHPDRDVAHNFKSVMHKVLRLLAARDWADLEKLLTDAKVPDEEVALAFDVLSKLVFRAYESIERAREHPDVAQQHWDYYYETALQELGWFELHPMAQVAVLATLGRVTLGLHWHGVRQAQLGSDGPATSLRRLARRAEKLAQYLVWPKWRRWLSIRWHFLWWGWTDE